jgi:flagellar secretion chaperone FliS
MHHASDQYLRNAVMTATPEQLQLMLYDGAIRFIRDALEALQSKNWEEVFNGFTRAQNIVLELLAALNYDVDRALCTQMAGLYNFIYRQLVDAHTHRDLSKAQEALRLLEYQRETWVLLLEKLRGAEVPAATPAAPERARTAAGRRGPAESRHEQTYGSLSVQG